MRRLALSPVEIAATTIAVALLLEASDLASSTFDQPLFVASLGASIVILFTQPGMSAQRSWAVIGGQTLSAGVGLLALWALPDRLVLPGALAVAGSLVVMRLARCVHPPAAATALLVVTAPDFPGLGFLVFPVLAGSIFVVAVAWIVHLVEPVVPERLGGRRHDRLSGGSGAPPTSTA